MADAFSHMRRPVRRIRACSSKRQILRYGAGDGGMRPAGRSIAALVGPDGLIRDAVRLLALHHQNRFPVVGDDGKPLGIVTRVGALDAFAR